ncbi:hypothetical protein [Mesoflavibacter zeaxanthinifaciens]|uniref:hypothetical protein n=1 Tax=Mesoflavibacter zeaxanthinifaciens TaxID=393060 RepID=UPI0004032E1D|nr:hypothetical protein [Mesoflavibacter zeaxanthinifaciens]
MIHINICPNCIHRNTCALTAQKDKVWSCSEYDENTLEEEVLETHNIPKQQNKNELELV